MAELEQLLPTLRPADAAALRFWIQQMQVQVRPQEQAASVAALLGDAARLGAFSGQRQGRAQLLRIGPVYRLTHSVVAPFSPPGTTLFIEETLAVSDLVPEHRVSRTVAPNGETADETEQRLISRGEADPGEFARLMAEVDSPPAHWQVRRVRPAEVLARAVAIWELIAASAPQLLRPVAAPTS